MPDCEYCGESFDGEDAYLDHLADEHAGDLGPIDRRKVEERGGGAASLLANIPTGPLALVLVIGVVVALIVYVTFFLGGSSARGPAGSAHGHGTMNVTVLGDTVDFSQQQYQVQNPKFHFERGNGRIWHVHATGVTLKWAMSTLGIGVTGDSVTYQGTTYRDGSSKYVVEVTVDGKPVDPAKYVLTGVEFQAAKNGQGPHVKIVVRREG